jgi:hypothetical protein
VPYDERLAARVRGVLGDRPGLTEKKMFGGLAFLLGGNMACGVSHDGESLLVRIPPEETEAALAEPGVRLMEMGGRSMKGWIYVGAEGHAKPKDLRRWVERGAAYASTLPPK